MKFGKEFASQKVPEWQQAYIDYDFQKTLLKEIQRFNERNRTQPSAAALRRKFTLYRAFSGLTQRNNSNYNHHHPRTPSGVGVDDVEAQQAILVNPVHRDGTKQYETTFLMAAEEGGEFELVYFRRLDDEFNKVNKFYKAKVDEVMKEADILNKQMDALIAFRIKVENPSGWHWDDRSADMTRLASNVSSSASALAASTPSAAMTASRRVNLETIEEGANMHDMGSSDDSDDPKVETDQEVKSNIRGSRPAPLEILNHVKMNKAHDTPRSTIKGFLKVPMDTELKFNRENLRKVEQQLKQAFVEFYRKLRLLKSFSFLNTLAISKIMKKYDKITSRNASKLYMNMVDESFLGSSDEMRFLYPYYILS